MSIDPETGLHTQLRWSRPEWETGVQFTAPVRHAGAVKNLIRDGLPGPEMAQSIWPQLPVDEAA